MKQCTFPSTVQYKWVPVIVKCNSYLTGLTPSAPDSLHRRMKSKVQNPRHAASWREIQQDFMHVGTIRTMICPGVLTCRKQWLCVFNASFRPPWYIVHICCHIQNDHPAALLPTRQKNPGSPGKKTEYVTTFAAIQCNLAKCCGGQSHGGSLCNVDTVYLTNVVMKDKIFAV